MINVYEISEELTSAEARLRCDDAPAGRPRPLRSRRGVACLLALVLSIGAGGLIGCGDGSDVGGDTTDTADTGEDDSAEPDVMDDTSSADVMDDTTGEPDGRDDTVDPDTMLVDAVDTVMTDSTLIDTTPPDTTPLIDTTPPPVATPEPGDLLITELLIDPGAVSDALGEWIEVRNRRAVKLDVLGCQLVDGDGRIAKFEDGVGITQVPPGAYFVIGRSVDSNVNGGAVVDLAVSDVLYANNVGSVVLECDGVEIDRVDYDAADWVIQSGVAIGFTLGAPQLVAENDDVANWCEQVTTFGAGDRGTPGAANIDCPARDTTLDFCEIVWPDTEVISEDEAARFRALIRDAGETTYSSGVDTIYFLVAEVGWGPVGSDPSQAAGWTWAPAVGTPGWDDAISGPGFDQYEATVPVLPIGAYSVTFRFSFDSGDSFVYCDTRGFDGEYALEDLGSLLVEDSPCLPNPCASPPAVFCDGNELVDFSPEGECSVVNDTAQCDYPEQRTNCIAAGGSCAGAMCVGVAVPPVEGDLVFSEVMKNPLAVADTSGEYVEMTNVSGAAIDLRGCILRDNGADSFTIPDLQPLVVLDGAQIVFGRSEDTSVNGGVPVDVAYGTSMVLNNGADALYLECGDVIVDQLIFNTAAFPNDNGRALQLNPLLTTAADNDIGASWCSSQLRFPAGAVSGDFGTPGEPNHACPDTIDRCRLMPPQDVGVLTNQSFVVAGHVLKAGVTDVTTGFDPGTFLVAEAGFGPAATQPASSTWTYLPATGDASWVDTTDPDWDRYVATLTAPAVAGLYDFAFRFSADGGISWTYCDVATASPGQDGSENGYQIGNAGHLTATEPNPCNPNPCATPPAPTCDGDELTVYPPLGVCSVAGVNLDMASCSYPPSVVQCDALGGICDGALTPPACSGAAATAGPGELVISEIMSRPGAVGDFFGEWIELTSVSPVPRNIAGCALRDNDGDYHVITTPNDALVVPAAGIVVLGRTTVVADNGGVAVDYAYGQAFGLGNVADEVVVECDGAIIDEVVYGAGWTDTSGAAKQLDPAATDAALNDDAAEWCDATAVYGAGQLGSPGAPNAACP